MTNIEKLEAAVGNSAYGQAIVAEAKKLEAEGPHKYGQNIVDSLHERIGVLKAYERIHAEAGEEAKATAEADKVAIAEKALAALK